MNTETSPCGKVPPSASPIGATKEENLRILGMFLVAGTINACGAMNEKKDGSRPNYDALEAEASARFEEWKIVEPASYRYIVRHNCFCGNPQLKVTVTGGEIVMVERQNPRTKAVEWEEAGEETAGKAESIPLLFAKIHAWAAERPDQLTASFDETLHYPKEFRVDFRESYADDEEVVFVDSFEVLTPKN